MKQQQLKIAKRIEDKPATIEGQILTIIDAFSPVGLSQWEIPTAKVLLKLNENRPHSHEFSAQYIGKKLRSMGFRRRISHGHSILIVDSSLLHALLDQYQINPLSPNQANQCECGGESIKSTGISIYFGMCPECAKEFFVRQLEYLNIKNDHYCFCNKHKTYWYVGTNLFGNWRLEKEEDWKRNEEFLSAYTKVFPVFPSFNRKNEKKSQKLLAQIIKKEDLE